jgi:hypothetical protein
MSNVVTLRATAAASAWKEAFVRAVLARMADVNPDAVDEASDRAYPQSGRLSPEAAAAVWVAQAEGRRKHA